MLKGASDTEKIISEIMLAIETDYNSKNYDKCLKAACQFFTNSSITGGILRRLIEIINECSKKIIDDYREAAIDSNKSNYICCSFCGKTSDKVSLFAGKSVFICSKCVCLLHKIVHKDDGGTREE